MDYKNFSQDEHEEFSTQLLVGFLETKREKIITGELDAYAPCGQFAKMIDDLLFCFFDDERIKVGIPKPTPRMTVSALLDFIENDVLEAIADRRPDLLKQNWQGSWEFCGKDSEDSEFGLGC